MKKTALYGVQNGHIKTMPVIVEKPDEYLLENGWTIKKGKMCWGFIRLFISKEEARNYGLQRINAQIVDSEKKIQKESKKIASFEKEKKSLELEFF